jgi:tetratricopeptide (TPR) repeat protein
LEFAARGAEEELKRQALLSEADRLFEDGIKRDRTDPYGYIGKLNIVRQNIERAKNKEEREELVVASLSLLEDAYEATQESPIIAGELAKVNDQVGSLDDALKIVKRAEKKNPTDMRLKQLLIRFSEEKGEPQEALKVAVEAAKTDPTSWRVQRSLARLRRKLKGTMQSIRGHYEAAIRHHKGDVGLVVELGAYLFIYGAFDEANKVFETVKNLTLSGIERNRIREMWRDVDNNVIVFEGKVKRLAGAKGIVVAVPENFEAFFWRGTGTSLLREGDDVRFSVGFNSQGAVARGLRPMR